MNEGKKPGTATDEVAEETAAGAEGEGKAHAPPHDRADREVDDDLRHHGADVLHPGEADLEHGETGLHEEDQHPGEDHPDGVDGDTRLLAAVWPAAWVTSGKAGCGKAEAAADADARNRSQRKISVPDLILRRTT